MARAVAYYRSSRDRSDVSIDAQRRELAEMAAQRGYSIVREFEDVVISANDERPGFQDLLAALKRADRGWDVILVMDTSRLARGVYFAQVFNHECEKHGVRVAYSKLPELDPLVKIVLMPVLQANDELHSYMSRVKGLAGMRENVLQGFRAGGRAPWGYRLRRQATGAIREGAAVTKSTLEPDPLVAPVARAYLEARARGVSRTRAAAAAGARLSPSSLVGTDWQAMTYAGHTVWNVHAQRVGGAHLGGRKRKPRADWTVQRCTHAALITDAAAEAVLRLMETSEMSAAVAAGKGQASRYLLTGLLVTSDGRRWQGTRQKGKGGLPVGYYRVGNRHMSADDVDAAVVARVLEDLRSDAFVEALAASARSQLGEADRAKPLRLEQLRLARDIDRQMELAAGLRDPAPALRRVDALEAQRQALTARIDAALREDEARAALAAATPEAIRAMLEAIAAGAERLEGAALKELIETFVERVTLDHGAYEAEVRYSVAPAVTRGSVAFPRGTAGFASLSHTVRVAIRRRRRGPPPGWRRASP